MNEEMAARESESLELRDARVDEPASDPAATMRALDREMLDETATAIARTEHRAYERNALARDEAQAGVAREATGEELGCLPEQSHPFRTAPQCQCVGDVLTGEVNDLDLHGKQDIGMQREEGISPWAHGMKLPIDRIHSGASVIGTQAFRAGRIAVKRIPEVPHDRD
jgi:hypothetical protein